MPKLCHGKKNKIKCGDYPSCPHILFFYDSNPVHLLENIFCRFIAIIIAGDISKALDLIFNIFVEPIDGPTSNRARSHNTIRIVGTSHHLTTFSDISVTYAISDKHAIAYELKCYGMCKSIITFSLSSRLQP